MRETTGKGSPLSIPTRQLSIAGEPACSPPAPRPPAKAWAEVRLAQPRCTRHKTHSGGQCLQTSLRDSTHQPSLFLLPAAQTAGSVRPVFRHCTKRLHGFAAPASHPMRRFSRRSFPSFAQAVRRDSSDVRLYPTQTTLRSDSLPRKRHVLAQARRAKGIVRQINPTLRKAERQDGFGSSHIHEKWLSSLRQTG